MKILITQKKFEKIDDEKFLNYIKKFELNNNNNDFNILTSRDDSLLKTMIKQKTKNLYLKRHKLNLSLEKNSLDNTQINNSNNNKNYFILNTKEINPKNIKHITKKSLLNTDRFTTKYHVQRLLNQKHNLNKFINNNKNQLENDIHNNNTTINNSINITINNYSKTIENNKNNNNRKRKWKSIEKEKTNQSLIHPFKINEESSFYPNEKILNTESNQNNKIKTEEIIIKSYNEKKNKINNINNNNEDKMLINKLLKMQKNYSKNKNSFSHKSFDHRTLIKNRNSNNQLTKNKKINRSVDNYYIKQKNKNEKNILKKITKNKKPTKNIKNLKKFNKFVNNPLKIKTDNFSMNNNKNYNNISLNNSIVNQINLNNNISFRNKKNKLDYLNVKNLPNLTERLNTEKSNDKYLNSFYLLTESERLKLNTIEKKKKKENSLEKSNKLNYLKTKNNHIKKRNSIQNSLILMNKGKKTQQNPINNYINTYKNSNSINYKIYNEFDINEIENIQLRPKKYEGIIDIICISYKNLRESILFIKKILEKKNIIFLHTSPYIFKCSKDCKKFDIEICRIESDLYYYNVKSKNKLDIFQKNLVLNIFEN